MESRHLKVAVVSLAGLLILAFVAVLRPPVSSAPETRAAEVEGQRSPEAESVVVGASAGFTMYDVRDGRPHCVYLIGGNLIAILGTCDQTDARLFDQN
jgi:hypothetical protein